MPESDLALLHDAARQAAEISLGHFGQPLDVEQKSDGAGPVTEADIAVNDRLETILRGARPDYGWLSEESRDDPARLLADKVFIIDPIDGTRSFIEGSKSWAHSLAVAERGRITAALIHMPAKGRTYAARIGAGATLNGAPIRPTAAPDPDAADVLTTRPSLDPRHWPSGLPGFRRSYRPSLAYRLGLVAEGRFDAMFTFRPSWEWDIAAGALILTEAGAAVSDKTGSTLRFNNSTPQTDGVIAAGPALHRALLTRLGVADAADPA